LNRVRQSNTAYTTNREHRSSATHWTSYQK